MNAVIEWPPRAVHRSLGRLRGLRTFSSLQASKVATGEIEASQFSIAMLERKASSQIGEGLTCASCRAVISGS